MAMSVAHPHDEEAIIIGLVSDTHGLLRDGVFEALAGVSQILHAGDVGGRSVLDALERIAPVRAVYGNVDPPDAPLPAQLRSTPAVSSIHVSHGHELGAPDAGEAARRLLAPTSSSTATRTGRSSPRRGAPGRQSRRGGSAAVQSEAVGRAADDRRWASRGGNRGACRVKYRRNGEHGRSPQSARLARRDLERSLLVLTPTARRCSPRELVAHPVHGEDELRVARSSARSSAAARRRGRRRCAWTAWSCSPRPRSAALRG